MSTKKSLSGPIALGLVTAMAAARKDRSNATWGHVCQVCGPGVWHKDGNVCLGICPEHWKVITHTVGAVE